jgi:hypothetical protein
VGAHLCGGGASLSQHLGRHVDARYRAFVADHLRGDQRVGAGARAKVEHPLTFCEASHRPWVGDAGERLDRCFGHVRQLVRVVEVFRPRAPGREDEVLLRLLRDGGVGLLDLALQQLDIDLDVNGHHASSVCAGCRVQGLTGLRRV